MDTDRTKEIYKFTKAFFTGAFPKREGTLSFAFKIIFILGLNYIFTVSLLNMVGPRIELSVKAGPLSLWLVSTIYLFVRGYFRQQCKSMKINAKEANSSDEKKDEKKVALASNS